MQPDWLLRVDLKCSGNGLLIIINQGRRENISNFINSRKLFKALVPFLYLGYSYVTIIPFVIIGSRGRTLESTKIDDDDDDCYDDVGDRDDDDDNFDYDNDDDRSDNDDNNDDKNDDNNKDINKSHLMLFTQVS